MYIQREVSAAARVKVHFKSQDSLLCPTMLTK